MSPHSCICCCYTLHHVIYTDQLVRSQHRDLQTVFLRRIKSLISNFDVNIFTFANVNLFYHRNILTNFHNKFSHLQLFFIILLSDFLHSLSLSLSLYNVCLRGCEGGRGRHYRM